MNKDFHCYATYCAAILAGYSHEESAVIGYSSQMVDLCTRTMLSKLHAPQSAATTQLQLELMDARTDIIGTSCRAICTLSQSRNAQRNTLTNTGLSATRTAS